MLSHTHRWTNIAVNYGTEPAPTTRVLRRCRCGDLGTIDLSGRWHDAIPLGKPSRPLLWDVLLLVLVAFSAAAAFTDGRPGSGMVFAVLAVSLLGLIGWELAARRARKKGTARAAREGGDQ